MKLLSALASACLAVTCAIAPPAQAAFPDHPIRFIVPFPPGGSTDVAARIICMRAQELLGQPIVIYNQGGGGAIVGSATAAQSAPDGYTLLLVQPSHASNPALNKTLPYDTEKAFVPISGLAWHPGLLVTSPSKPYKTFKEFIAYVKAHPGKVSYATAGVGTFPHLTMELLSEVAGLSMLHVPYKGAGPTKTDLVAGRVDVKVDAYSTSIGLIQNGELIALAVTGKGRIPQMPDVPAVEETYPGFDSSIWMGVAAPAGVPPAVVQKLEKAFADAIKDPQVIHNLDAQGIYPLALSGQQLGGLIHSEIGKWAKTIKEAGIVAQ
ncbi:MAG TPA: tripartite tricarboxylate transporter substrate binding protein [Bordetella sp.]|nr:tripartite tricarboxylate transporter substrate binding protein [Bordetella sp.]